MNVKDFRELSDYPVPLVEEDFAEALVEAGVTFDTPFALRVRIKDLDPRLFLAKGDLVDKGGDEFRLNLYFPPFLPPPEYVEDLNIRARHMLCHFAQARAMRGDTTEMDQEKMVQMEVEAHEFSFTGTCCILREFAQST